VDRIAEVKPKIGFDDYLLTHSKQDVDALPKHSIRKLTIAEMIDQADANTNAYEIREIIKTISAVGSEIEKSSCIKKLHEKTKIAIRAIQKDIASYTRAHLAEENKIDADCPYSVDEAGNLYKLQQYKDSVIPIKLANFCAQITEETTEDNGLDISHTYTITGAVQNKRLPPIAVPSVQFPTLNWIHKWGAEAIIEPGQNAKDFVRHAIQVMSTETKKSDCFTHTGWREINGEMAYLTSIGAIGAKNVQVKLSHDLQRYCLPLIPEQETEAIQASLSFLDLGKREITLPLVCVLYLSVLTTLLDPMPNFSAYIYGGTGVFKTALSVVLLQHFGDSWNASLLPNFGDTANSLEKRAFLLKDALLVLDDYHPDSRKSDSQLKESIAQRLIRSYSNRTGRGRLNADTTDKGRYEPRGMLLITGEELVMLQSTLARLVVIKLSEGDISQTQLSALQAKAHLLPHAMSSFVSWVQHNIQEIRTTFKSKFSELRAKACAGNMHKRLPEQSAFLQFALDSVLSWTVDKGIVASAEATKLSNEGWNIFMKLCGEQSQRIESEDPVEKFFDILNTLIAQEKVKIKNVYSSVAGVADNPNGELIGYENNEFFYFLPQALWHTVQKYCSEEGVHFPFRKDTFYRMLKEKKFLVTTDNQTATVEYLEGKARRVLKMERKFLFESEIKS